MKNLAPLLQVKYAYSLAKGGVAIHLNNSEDKKTLLKSFTAEAFGRAKITDLADENNIVFLKNVPTYISTNKVELTLRNNNNEVKSVQRLQKD